MATTATPATPFGRRTPSGRRTPFGAHPDADDLAADRPRYARPMLLALTALAALLYSWGINRAQYHAFYAAAARSMTASWKAFLFGSFDPGNTITLDKLPGFLWPQALSARLFGFHPWSLTLPQALEGVLAMLVMYHVVRRWAGVRAGLLAAAAFAVTPAVTGLFRTSVEDPAFTLLLLLAADATQRAARTARTRTLLLAGLWVGLAFQAKMLEAWAVLPVLAGVYLVAAPTVLRRRLMQLAVAGAVVLAVSASWMLAVVATPPADRPYIDGTTDNSVVSMVVGYNFLNRFASVGLSAEGTGSVTSVRGGPRREQSAGPQPAASAADRAGLPGGPQGGRGRDDGWTKLVGRRLASQTGWLYPFAAVSAVCGLLWRRGRPRTDVLRSGFLLWGGWLAVYVLVFSAGSVGGHTYYMGVIAAPLAALTGGGAALLGRALRTGGTRAWVLPAAVAATAAWGALLAARFPGFRPWLPPALAVLGATALVLLLPVPITRRLGRARAGSGMAAALAVLLLAPASWSADVLSGRSGHAGVMGSIGPAAPPHRHPPGSRGGALGSFGNGSLDRAQQALLRYVQRNRGGAEYLFAASDWSTAAPYILADGASVLPMGGFSGLAPVPDLPGFRRDIAAGRVRFVVVGPPRGRFGASATGRRRSPAAAVTAWVRASCDHVPARVYGGGADAGALYHCS